MSICANRAGTVTFCVVGGAASVTAARLAASITEASARLPARMSGLQRRRLRPRIKGRLLSSRLIRGPAVRAGFGPRLAVRARAGSRASRADP